MVYKNHDLSHLWILRSSYEHRYVSFSPILTVCVIHDSLGVVNLEISLFSLDNDNNDRWTDYFIPCACMRGNNCTLGKSGQTVNRKIEKIDISAIRYVHY